MNRKKFDTDIMVKMSLLIAIIILQTWVPFLGYINIPPVSVTIIHITVIVATLWLGTKEGVIIGFVWGVNSLARAALMPSTPFQALIFTSPIISIIPRMLMPLIVGMVANILRKGRISSRLEGIIGGMLGSVMNTVLVLGAIGLFKQTTYVELSGMADPSMLWKVLGGIVVVNGIPEMIAAGIVTPILLLALRSKFHGKKQSY